MTPLNTQSPPPSTQKTTAQQDTILNKETDGRTDIAREEKEELIQIAADRVLTVMCKNRVTYDDQKTAWEAERKRTGRAYSVVLTKPSIQEANSIV